MRSGRIEKTRVPATQAAAISGAPWRSGENRALSVVRVPTHALSVVPDVIEGGP